MYGDVPVRHELLLPRVSYSRKRVFIAKKELRKVGLDRRSHDDTHFLAGPFPASSVPDRVVLAERSTGNDHRVL